jgi:hypothetical protein
VLLGVAMRVLLIDSNEQSATVYYCENYKKLMEEEEN